jgi:hypothetical protein
MPWFEVTFVVKAESIEAFHAEFDEGKVTAALPGYAHLVWIEEKPTVVGSIRSKLRRLRGAK